MRGSALRSDSCILVNHALPLRWRGKYNEDTDLSLRALTAGWCTVLFHAFLIDKHPTMQMKGGMKGGNTNDLYANGRLEFAQSLQPQHPDVAKVVQRYNRWHHSVDYDMMIVLKNHVVYKIGLANSHAAQLLCPFVGGAWAGSKIQDGLLRRQPSATAVAQLDRLDHARANRVSRDPFQRRTRNAACFHAEGRDHHTRSQVLYQAVRPIHQRDNTVFRPAGHVVRCRVLCVRVCACVDETGVRGQFWLVEEN